MKVSVVVIFAAAIVVGMVVTAYLYFQEITKNEIEGEFADWIVSGPFKVQKFKHKIGEFIFMSVGELRPDEVGEIVIIRPNDEVYYTIPFDGTAKSTFNHYFTPELSRFTGICTVDDIIGTWKIFFDGVNYKPIAFVVTEEILQGEEEYYEPVC